jgi:chaperonin GroES
MKKAKKKAAKPASNKVRKAAPKSKVSANKPAAASTNKTGVTPLGDRVLVRPLAPEEMGTANSFGLIIPDTVDKEKPEQGTVVAVGPGKVGDDNELIPVSVSVGDRVMFNKYGFDEIKVGGVEYYIVSEANILAILKN